MYTNIDTAHNLLTIDQWLTKMTPHLPSSFPKHLILEAIKLVMENNIFLFGNQHYLQKTGTAMGTPCACILATIYFSLHEDFLIQKYSKHILFYKRFIDDAIYLWRTNGDKTSSLLAFDQFKHDMDQFGLLRWTHLPLSNKVHFLDLTITIDFANKKFLFKTFQKPQNLYLYLPPNSAHPPGMLKSLIFGLIRKYNLQNTHAEDFTSIKNKLFSRLIARGHQHKDILPIFEEAMINPTKTITNTRQNVKHQASNNENIFFKYLYHPKNISRRTIQKTFHKHCSLPITKIPHPEYESSDDEDPRDVLLQTSLTVAYQTDKNLRDILIPSKLQLKNKK